MLLKPTSSLVTSTAQLSSEITHLLEKKLFSLYLYSACGLDNSWTTPRACSSWSSRTSELRLGHDDLENFNELQRCSLQIWSAEQWGTLKFKVAVLGGIHPPFRPSYLKWTCVRVDLAKLNCMNFGVEQRETLASKVHLQSSTSWTQRTTSCQVSFELPSEQRGTLPSASSSRLPRKSGIRYTVSESELWRPRTLPLNFNPNKPQAHVRQIYN